MANSCGVLCWTTMFLLVTQTNSDDKLRITCNMNILIVIDMSGSVRQGFNVSKQFVIDISSELQIGPNAHRPGLITYTSNVKKYDWGFAKNNQQFLKALNDKHDYQGLTKTGKALGVAEEMMQTRNKSNPTVILVVTDGHSSDNPEPVAAKLRQMKDVSLFVAATGPAAGVDKKELLAMVGGVDWHFIRHKDRGGAATQAKALLRKSQERCRTTTSTTTTTTTTTTTNPITGCEMDLVLVMDFSTTTRQIYDKYMDMATQLIKSLKIGDHYTRRFKEQSDVIKELQSLKSIGGTTALGTGIMEGIKQTEERQGARPEIATKVMVVFTDGYYNKGPEPKEAAAKAVEEGFEVYSCAYSKEMENVLPTMEEILLAVAQDNDHAYNDSNFEVMMAQIRKRNEKCMGGEDKSKGKTGSKGRRPKKPTGPQNKKTGKRIG